MRDENDAKEAVERSIGFNSRAFIVFAENVRQYKWIKDVLARRRQSVIESLAVAQQNIEYKPTAKQCHVAEDCFLLV